MELDALYKTVYMTFSFHRDFEAKKSITILPIDCYRHFITDEIIDLMVRETNRYAEQYLETHEISRRSKVHQWKPTTDVEMLNISGIIIKMEWCKCRN